MPLPSQNGFDRTAVERVAIACMAQVHTNPLAAPEDWDRMAHAVLSAAAEGGTVEWRAVYCNAGSRGAPIPVSARDEDDARETASLWPDGEAWVERRFVGDWGRANG